MNNYIECKCIAFSAVYFQMSPWIVCPWGWILTLIAFVWGFSSVCFKWFLLRPVVPSVAWVPIFLHYVISEESSKYHPVGWIVTLAAFVDFTQLWIIKWVLKTCAFEAYFWPNKTSNEILMPGGGQRPFVWFLSHVGLGTGLLAVTSSRAKEGKNTYKLGNGCRNCQKECILGTWSVHFLQKNNTGVIW